MKSSIILFTLFSFLSINCLKAQSGLGATVGFGGTTFSVEPNQKFKDTATNFDLSYPKTSMRLGMNIGIFYNIRIAKLLVIRPTLTVQLNQSGNIYLNKLDEVNNIKMEVTSQRFTCPVLINFKKKGVVPYLNLAPAIQYNLGFGDNAKNIGFNNLDFLAQVGFGVKIPMKFFSISPELNFAQGLINQKQNVGSYLSNAIESLKSQSLSLNLIVAGK